jgi:hypothetical protein
VIPFELREQHDDMGNAPHLMSPVDRRRVFGDRPTWNRAGGSCLCTTCGKEFNDHPPVIGALWLTRLCDDELVKL